MLVDRIAYLCWWVAFDVMRMGCGLRSAIDPRQAARCCGHKRGCSEDLRPVPGSVTLKEKCLNPSDSLNFDREPRTRGLRSPMSEPCAGHPGPLQKWRLSQPTRIAVLGAQGRVRWQKCDLLKGTGRGHSEIVDCAGLASRFHRHVHTCTECRSRAV